MDDDPIAPGNRKLMDYLFEKKEEVPNEIYITLSNMIQQKENNRETTNKFFKVEYSLTETIAIAHRGDGCIELSIKYMTSNYKRILCSIKEGERTHTSTIDDILHGFIESNSLLPIGTTFVKTEFLQEGGVLNDIDGKISTTMTIFSFEELDLFK